MMMLKLVNLQENVVILTDWQVQSLSMDEGIKGAIIIPCDFITVPYVNGGT